MSSSPFVVGRGSGCDLELPSRTISRRHCSIVFDESSVLIRDLGSHNGTVIGGNRIDSDAPHMLSHHDRVQVGKFLFRISIRDRKTGEPYRASVVDHSTVSGAVIGPAQGATHTAQLLSELDDLASSLDLSPDSPLRSNQSTAPWTSDESTVSDADADQQPASNEEESDSMTVVLGRELAAQGGQDSSAEDPDEKDNKPQKLPEHLRPKGPVNSQNAAAQALRHLWETKK